MFDSELIFGTEKRKGLDILLGSHYGHIDRMLELLKGNLEHHWTLLHLTTHSHSSIHDKYLYI